MTTTPSNASSNLPGRPPVVDLATWQAMGAFLGPILGSEITPEDVDKAVTNSAAK